MLLNCKQCHKNVSIVPNDFQENVNDSNVGVNESIFFSFLMSNDAHANECPKMLLNVVYFMQCST